ncbi:hypothetical protein CN090_28340 [Sinorhizobium meliloti]|uniref:hypothetical protein n=1 Tax=Rhizobium meliloti TaxID=382 RepID=UPI000FD4F88A|nr:hypothetical protein [Sinorhizobium meliloti]RVG88398.1 hypothetical protein CN218_27110 [Sinorhizobium meliloti]RVN59226.1 hypothetical protein CN104_24700 [Sinorhizobium meliloti]RVO20876.1 hypothetical protein CN100_20730 [Sinorhizobium meliloti]RVO45101.1 hypothetical protein CN090_28340 [Sinorhizobium meliloti]RVP85383.1 hypothetical protein CN072_14330 [Sinorhizobium meliloti]
MSENQTSQDRFVVLRKLEDLESRVIELREEIQAIDATQNEVQLSPELGLETRFDDEAAFAELFGLRPGGLLETLELRFATDTYSWECNFFNVCHTTYEGSVFFIRKDNGKIITWNLIESATKKDTGLPFWSKSPYYRYAENASHIGFGFGRDGGRTCHVSTCINCYSDHGAISMRWDASAC